MYGKIQISANTWNNMKDDLSLSNLCYFCIWSMLTLFKSILKGIEKRVFCMICVPSGSTVEIIDNLSKYSDKQLSDAIENNQS